MTVKTYRKLPVEIQALYWDGTASDEMCEAIESFLDTCNATEEYSPMYSMDRSEAVGEPTVLYLDTLEGTMMSYTTCYIIRGVKGEAYICEEDIFEQTYEEVTNV